MADSVLNVTDCHVEIHREKNAHICILFYVIYIEVVKCEYWLSSVNTEWKNATQWYVWMKPSGFFFQKRGLSLLKQ